MDVTRTELSEALVYANTTIANCRRLLRGRVVNDLRMGDAGISREWLEHCIATHETLADRLDEEICKMDEAVARETTGMTADERAWLG